MRNPILELLKDACLLGLGCAMLGFGSCRHTPALAQDMPDNISKAVKKCGHQAIPFEKMAFANQYERKE